MHWLQLIAGLGIGGVVTSFLDRRFASSEARRARDHATAEARAVRVFEIRFEAYRELSSHLERAGQFVERTEPFLGPMPEPPEMPSDDAWLALTGTAAVAMSDPARDANASATKAVRTFRERVEEYRASEERVEGWSLAPDSTDDLKEDSPRKQMEDARRGAFAALRHAQGVMRAELANL